MSCELVSHKNHSIVMEHDTGESCVSFHPHHYDARVNVLHLPATGDAPEIHCAEILLEDGHRAEWFLSPTQAADLHAALTKALGWDV